MKFYISPAFVETNEIIEYRDRQGGRRSRL